VVCVGAGAAEIRGAVSMPRTSVTMSAMRRSRMGIFSKLRWPFSQIQKKGVGHARR
jgi:hypothetical protein